MDEVEVIEKYIILLLGVKYKEPIPSSIHLQKELFVLSQANEKVGNVLKFMKHYFGPYSAELKDVSENPIYFDDAFIKESNNKIYLTSKGKEIFNEIINEMGESEKFKEFLSLLKMVRELYDKLTTDELLLLIYITYDDYTLKSSRSKELLKTNKRNKIAKNLLRKGVITEKKYKELVYK